MQTEIATSDGQMLDLLRHNGAMSVAEMAQATRVTATAVRQRLTRLMGQGLIERGRVSADETGVRAGRGRPSHHYSLTEKGRRQAGNNFPDLAIVLWDEIRGIKDQEVRRGLLERIATALAGMYRDHVSGSTLTARMESLKRLFGERRVPLSISTAEGRDANASDDRAGRGESAAEHSSSQLPLLTVAECPYPELAEKDRGICAVEKMLFAKLIDHPLRLSQCRLDGHDCCQFETN
jgi:predicted ArsR family transcriptional regulator